MITVEAYTELPETYKSDDEALLDIENRYQFRDWQAVCDVTYMNSAGAVVDIETELGELYFDPELRTFIFRIEEEVTVEEEVLVDTGLLDEHGEPIYETQYQERTEVQERIRAVSYLIRED